MRTATAMDNVLEPLLLPITLRQRPLREWDHPNLAHNQNAHKRVESIYQPVQPMHIMGTYMFSIDESSEY